MNVFPLVFKIFKQNPRKTLFYFIVFIEIVLACSLVVWEEFIALTMSLSSKTISWASNICPHENTTLKQRVISITPNYCHFTLNVNPNKKQKPSVNNQWVSKKNSGGGYWFSRVSGINAGWQGGSSSL